MHVITPLTLETARLRLRPLVIADAVALDRIQSDPEHMRFYPHPFAARESREWIEGMQARFQRDGFALLAVEDRATGEFLGNVGPLVQKMDGVNEVELDWSITRARARQGSATEAAPDNVPSRGVAENLGMTVWKDITRPIAS